MVLTKRQHEVLQQMADHADEDEGEIAYERGTAYLVERLRLCGNGVVPVVAAYAFLTLADRLRVQIGHESITGGVWMMELRVGQIWKDNDKRVSDRFLEVVKIGSRLAICRQVTRLGRIVSTRFTTIDLNRFKPTSTGYVLVKEVGQKSTFGPERD